MQFGIKNINEIPIAMKKEEIFSDKTILRPQSEENLNKTFVNNSIFTRNTYGKKFSVYGIPQYCINDYSIYSSGHNNTQLGEIKQDFTFDNID